MAGLVDGTGTGVPGTARIRNSWLKKTRVSGHTGVKSRGDRGPVG